MSKTNEPLDLDPIRERVAKFEHEQLGTAARDRTALLAEVDRLTSDLDACREMATDAVRRAKVQQMEPGRWWRAVGPDGKIWCETSSEDEARDMARPEDRLQRIYTATITEWRDEQ